jgi:hypothetical protein
MKAPKQTDILDHKIATLKIKRATAFTELKEQYFVVHNSITVSNIVNQGITEIYKTAINKDNLYTNIASVLGGYLTKRLVVGASKNPFKQILGYGVQFAVTQLISKISNQQKNQK